MPFLNWLHKKEEVLNSPVLFLSVSLTKNTLYLICIILQPAAAVRSMAVMGKRIATNTGSSAG